jgi:hypothetical protein
MVRARLIGRGLIVGAVAALSTALLPLPSGAQPANAPGTVDCDLVTGIIKFNPALTGSPQTVTAKAFLKLSGCGVGSGAVRRLRSPDGPTGHGVSAAGVAGTSFSTSTITASLSCVGLNGAGGAFPVVSQWTTRWTLLRGTASTTTTFNGFASIPGGNLSLPAAGGGATATGSYTGTDGGSSSSITLVYGITGKCQPAGPGLKALKISSGRFVSG